MPAFGRLEAKDPRDEAYPMRLLMAPEPSPRNSRHWSFFWKPLDQGDEGTCVGHGMKHWMLSAPVVQTKPNLDPLATQIYDIATEHDEWQGNERNRQFGTSVRAGMKAVQLLGYVHTYYWATTLEETVNYLIDNGPVVIGVNWYTGMLSPDPTGLIRVAGGVEGGHCVCLLGANRKTRLVRGVNSWGNWGPQRGRFWLSFDDLARLIAEDGEICTAVEVRRV